MKRDDWLERLWKTLDAARDRPFVYGNCVLLAAECVDAMTDSDFRTAVGPLIDEAQERPYFLEELEGYTCEKLGEPVAINWADQGDVVLLDLRGAYHPAGPALGICTGTHIACAGIPTGVVYLKRERGLKAWRVK